VFLVGSFYWLLSEFTPVYSRLDQDYEVGAFLFGLVVLAVICLIVYGLVRAIGWVVGGFMAS
jgi:hypothetical protein